MERDFIMMPEFEKMWKSLNLNDDDLRKLQMQILINPQIGDVIKGTGGLRKMRFALNNRGKSKSIRVVYVDFVVYEKVFLITAYPKNIKDNLSKSECNSIKKLITDLKKVLEEGN